MRVSTRLITIVLASLLIIDNSNCKKKGTDQPASTSPSISSFAPLQGIPGDTISISGVNFGTSISGCSVSFNGAASVIVTVTNTLIKAIVPAGSTTGKITVSIKGKTASSAIDFIKSAYVSTLAGDGNAGYIDATGINASFKYPTDLVLDNLGNIYVTDASNFRIRKITPQGVVTTLAGSGTNGSADGTGNAASFGTMLGIAIDKSNTFLYVADLGNNNIRKISMSGIVTTVAGGGGPGFINGASNVAKFHLPMGVAVDDAGNIYVADAGNNCIRMISSSGVVSTVAGNGTPGNVDGTVAAARFNNPIKLKIKSNGDLIALDQNNHSVRLINSGGTVSTISGTGIAGFTDGSTGIAQFNSPAGLCLDILGNIYIGDQSNQRIRKISATGTVTTIAGSGIAGYADGATTNAKFNSPCGLDINTSGVIYVVDNQNQRIRYISN